MKTRNNILLPRAQKPLTILGENIRLARLRRRYSMEQVAERADISRPTLHSIERGNSNVTIGAYVKVLFVLGLEGDIAKVATDDILGRKLQDFGLTVEKSAQNKQIGVTASGGMAFTMLYRLRRKFISFAY